MSGSITLPHGYRPDPYSFQDHIVKVEHGVPVTVRLWPAQDVKEAPWLYWIHGGGFSAGYCQRIAGWIHQAFGKTYHIVSVGYRMAPQVSFEEELGDIHDGWKWCHETLPDILGQGSIDLTKSVIAGDSAGGVFASLSGFFFEPRPKVIVNLYGPVNLGHSHFHQPAPNMQQLLDTVRYTTDRTEEQLEAALRDNNPANAKTIYPWWFDLDVPIDQLQEFLGLPDYAYGQEEKLRMDLYTYMSIKRNRFAAVFRKHECATDVDFASRLESYSSLSLIDKTDSYPTTYILHGTADTAAPVGPSQEFYSKLETKGFTVEADWVEGAEHSFDVFIMGPEDPKWGHIARLAAFVNQHIEGVKLG